MREYLDSEICIVDTETTGLDPATCKLVEVAAVRLSRSLEVIATFDTLVDPGVPIPAETSAIHHLTSRHVAGAPSIEQATADLAEFIYGTPVAAHNAGFDAAFLPMIQGPWLCTKRLASHIFPDAPSKSNQVLRYWLDLRVDTKGLAPHRALSDCLVTAEILAACVREQMIREQGSFVTVADLLAYSNRPILISKMPFGKHKGEPLDRLPASYVFWLIGCDIDPDLRHSLKMSEVLRHANVR